MKFTADPGLHLWVGQHRIHPSYDGGERPGETRFRLLLPQRDIRLRSRSTRPHRTEGAMDGRVLGYRVRAIRLEAGPARIEIDPAALVGFEGFHEWETPGWIWTNGDAVIPADALARFEGEVEVTIVGESLARYEVEDPIRLQAQALLRRCLSLGDNCDLAFAQSHFDAEPLDLLRWAATPHEQLCRGLRNGFAGLGDDAHTQLVWLEAGEYRLVDARYSSFHTRVFARTDAKGEEQIRQSGIRRLRFLRGKLLHDLASGVRMAVARSRDPAVGEAEVTDLHRAFRSLTHGPLLVLRPAREASEIGTVNLRPGALLEGWHDPGVREQDCWEGLHGLCAAAEAKLTRAA